MKTRFFLALWLLIGASFTVASPQDVYVNSSPSATFPAYHTYVWGEQQNSNQIANSLLAREANIQIAITL
ncbi:MAG: hypothetical protein WCA00_09380 [Candidatus Acidiferrales bacterium]